MKLLKMRKTIYANVHMDILRHWRSNEDWTRPSGSWYYESLRLIGVEFSTEEINRPGEMTTETIVLELYSHHPFTYSFSLGDPIMAADMPADFQPILDALAPQLLHVSRLTSIAGPQFKEINHNLNTALGMLGKTIEWEEADWQTTPWATDDALRFTVLKSAIERTLTNMKVG
jgi:hypothetical protein